MSKTRRNQIIVTVLALAVAAAGYINYAGDLSSLFPSNSQEVDATANPVDEVSGDILSNDAEPDDNSMIEPGSAVLTSGSLTSGNTVSAAKLNREQIRAKSKETLLDIVNNEKLQDSVKSEAVSKLAALTDVAEKEIASELLLEAKGFSDVVVSILDGNAEVVVNLSELNDVQRAQIEDIVKRKTGLTADKITINVCNNANN